MPVQPVVENLLGRLDHGHAGPDGVVQVQGDETKGCVGHGVILHRSRRFVDCDHLAKSEAWRARSLASLGEMTI